MPPSNSLPPLPPGADDDNESLASAASEQPTQNSSTQQQPSGPTQNLTEEPFEESPGYLSENVLASSDSDTLTSRRRTFPWFWLGAFIGTLLGAAGLGLAAWAWIFINKELSPVISEALTDSLDRPVKLGDVENVTLGSLRVGPSTIGASVDDPTNLTAESATVKFDLIETLFTSELGLELIVDGANGYLKQDEEKGWLNVEVPEQENQEKEKQFEVRLDAVRVTDSELTLQPLPPEGGEAAPIFLDDVSAEVDLDDVVIAEKSSRRTRFEIAGRPEENGEITFKGEVQPVAAADDKVQYATNLSVQADQAPLADILGFTLSTINLATDQVAVDSGRVSGTMEMSFRPGDVFEYSGVIGVDDAVVEAAILPLPLENLDGQTRFKGNRWAIDSIKGEYGDIAIAGEGLIDFDKGYDLDLKTEDVTVTEFTETIDLELPVPAEGTFDAVAKVQGDIADPQFVGMATAVSALQVDKLIFTSASTNFLLQGQQLYLDDIAATPNTGGALRGSGEVFLGADSPFTFRAAARSVPATEVAKIYGLEPGFKLGLVSADATVVGNSRGVTTTVNWDAPTAQYPGSGTIDIDGSAIAFRNTAFQLGGGTVTGSGNLVDGLWNGDIDLQNVQLNAFSEDLTGDISGQFRVSGNTADTRIGTIRGSGDVAFSNGLATFNPQFASLSNPLTAQVAWNGEKLEIIDANTDRITANGTLTPIFDKGFEGLERLDLDVVAQDYGINEIPFVTIPSAFDLAGRADFTGSIIGNPESPTISGDVLARNLVVNRLPFNDQLTGSVNYSASNGLGLNLTGATDNIALNVGPDTGQVGAIPSLNFDVGWRSAFANGQTRGDILQVEAGNFPLSALNFPPEGAGDIGQLRGTLTAANLDINLNNQAVDGDIVIDQLGLGYIGAGRLAGQVRYANDLAILNDGELNLNGNRYQLSGSVAIDGPVPVYTASLATQEGNIQNLLNALSIYRIEDFRRGLTAPDWLENPPSESLLDSILATTPTGRADAALIQQLQRLAELQAIQAEAEIAAASQPLPPLKDLNGPFAGRLQLRGSGSNFELGFDLTGDDWEWGNAYSAQEVVAKGTLTPNVLTLEPVRFASVIPVPNELAVVSSTTGNADDIEIVEVESGSGELTTAALETPQSQSITVDTRDESANAANGLDSAAASEDQTAVAAVNLAGQLVFGRDTQLTSTLQATAQNLNIATLSKVLELPIDIDGYANATASLGGTLANPQLRGLTELEAATINDIPIQLADAQFLYQNARLSLTSELIATTPEQPLTLSAQIPYAFNFMEAKPQTKDISVEIKVQDEGLALLNIFTQQVAWESGSGQFQLNVGGTLNNPSIAGTATLDAATISAQILPEPLTNVTGRAIFEGEQVIVEGLQGQFSDGQLTAAGTFPLLYPIISGPQLSALTEAALPDASDMSTSENILVEDAEAVEAEIAETVTSESVAEAQPEEPVDPLFPQPLVATAPLTVNFRDIDLELQDLYAGGVNGQIIVGGSALLGGPQVGGQVVLSDGQVMLPDGGGDDAIAQNADFSTDPFSVSSDSTEGITTNFRDLRLTLGNAIRITQGSLLNFTADGTLVLNGPPDDLRPDGTINLRSGGVNLFTTLFRLRGRNNTAIFTPETGLNNPLLDVSLRASVPEVRSRGAIASTPFAVAETADTSNNGFNNPGSLRTIRVQANVVGPANAIFENLELTSSPGRSEDELIALIGGGFVNAIESTVGSLSGEGGDGFSGLINLVGGGVLTRVQDIVGNALSLSEFSLFPVTAASRAQSEEDRETGLDIGASAGFDVTDSSTLTVTKILTDTSNPEFGASYRLTDALTVRGSTNFDDINQFLLEYELRF